MNKENLHILNYKSEIQQWNSQQCFYQDRNITKQKLIISSILFKPNLKNMQSLGSWT